MRFANNDEVRSLSDFTFNVAANKNIRIKPKQRKELQKHKNRIIKVITTRSVARRRKLLQHGGFLQALMIPLLTSLATEVGQQLITSLFKRKNGQ